MAIPETPPSAMKPMTVIATSGSSKMYERARFVRFSMACPSQDGLNVTIKALLGESDRHTRQPLRLINDAANERRSL